MSKKMNMKIGYERYFFSSPKSWSTEQKKIWKYLINAI